MPTLTLCCTDGHEVSLSYELPTALPFDCFVPGRGILTATVDVSADDLGVGNLTDDSGFQVDSAVLEQADDVCSVFERALPLSLSGRPEALAGVEACTWWQREFERWEASRLPEDAKTLTSIAELATAEADLYARWCALPDSITKHLHMAPVDPEDEQASSAHGALEAFVHVELLERAQKIATAAAKKRQAEWDFEHRQQVTEARIADFVDLRIDEMKAGGR